MRFLLSRTGTEDTDTGGSEAGGGGGGSRLGAGRGLRPVCGGRGGAPAGAR